MPKSVLHKLRNQAGQILGNDFLRDISELIPQSVPAVDMYKSDRELIVVAELPGLASAEHIKISTNGKELQLRGYRDCDYQPDEEDIILSERVCGAFQRKLELPREVLTDGISAKYRNGLLTIRLKLKPEADEQAVDVEFVRE